MASEAKVYAQAKYTWNSKSYDGYKDKYWYCWGVKKSNKDTYLKIGCVATYRIAYENLSNAKKAKCDS